MLLRAVAVAAILNWTVPAAPTQEPERGRGPNRAGDGDRVQMVQALRERAERRKAEARVEALIRGWRVRGDSPSGRRFELMAVPDSPDLAPEILITDNVNAAISTGASQIRNTSPYNLNGSGLTVGVWDGGSILQTHQEFAGRLTLVDAVASHWHATHVGGTIGAAGVSASALGMAPSVHLDSYDWDDDEAEMAAAGAATAGAAGKIPLSNHSYGFVTGWETGDFSGSTAPHWFGVNGEAEDRGFGQYGSTSASWDGIVAAHPYYLPFKSAGNDRNNPAPSNGQTYFYFSGGSWQSKAYNAATDPKGDGLANATGAGYDTVTSVGIAKNIMTVGAVNDAVSGGSRSVANAAMSPFSGWGPADDGRVKPDIVANGIGLTSASDSANNAYAAASGTSMASPNACGSAALLVEYYGDLFGTAMRASTR
ncbi:MAG: S8 family serine peptidase [Verrucomicrobiales bacterium]